MSIEKTASDPHNLKEILRGDIYYTSLVSRRGVGKRQQRTQVWEAIRERRREILSSPNPSKEVERSNQELEKNQAEYDRYRQDIFEQLTPKELADLGKLFRRTPN